MAGRPPGAQNKDKPFRTALMLELKDAGEDMPALREIARGLIERAKASDPAAKEVADRLDGKPAQAIVGDADADPIKILQRIERVIIDPKHPDSEGVQPATEPGLGD